MEAAFTSEKAEFDQMVQMECTPDAVNTKLMTVIRDAEMRSELSASLSALCRLLMTGAHGINS